MVIDLSPLAQEPNLMRDRAEEKTRVGQIPVSGLRRMLPRKRTPIVVARPAPRARRWPLVLGFALGAVVLTASGFGVGKLLMRVVPVSGRAPAAHSFASMMPSARPAPVKRTAAPTRAPSAAAAPVARRAARPLPPPPSVAPIDPEAAQYLSAGHLFYKAGNFAEARDAYKQAMKADETNGEPRFWLAMAYAHEGKSWRSCHQFREYRSLFPSGPRASYVAARIADCDG